MQEAHTSSPISRQKVLAYVIVITMSDTMSMSLINLYSGMPMTLHNDLRRYTILYPSQTSYNQKTPTVPFVNS